MNSSKKNKFSADEIESLSLWDVPDVAGKNKSERVKEDAVAPLLTVDEIQATQQQAYDEAYANGKQEGHEQGFAEGKQLGFQEGKTEGLEQGYEENKQLLHEQVKRFFQLLDCLNKPFEQLDDEVEHSLVLLATLIAKQVVRRELKLDPGQIVAVAREAMNAMPVAQQKIVLSLHPDDAELVREAMSIDDITPSWTINEDPILTRGGCLVSSDNSRIDATVENKIATIIATVLGDERHNE